MAKLSGAANSKVAAVRKGKKYYFVAPKKLGGVQEVPADSLTDCLNYSVGVLGAVEKRKRKS